MHTTDPNDVRMRVVAGEWQGEGFNGVGFDAVSGNLAPSLRGTRRLYTSGFSVLGIGFV